MLRLYYCLLIVLPLLLNAQHSAYQLAFRISATEMEALSTTHDDQAIDFLEHRVPFDTIRSGVEEIELPLGHFVILGAAGEQLKWWTVSHHRHQIYLHNDGRRLRVEVIDDQGQQVIADAVWLDKRKLRYDQRQGLYHTRKPKGQLLKAYLPGDTLFYRVQEEIDKSLVVRRWKYFRSSKVGYVVTTPVRWTESIYHYGRNLLKYGQWRPRPWPLERLARKLFGRKSHQHSGYMASNQPKYRAGDTLQLVAYIANHRAKPLKEHLNLRISDGGKAVLDTLLKPQEPGRFTMNWSLGDSLRLDQSYRIQLHQNDNFQPFYGIQHQFTLEDYELEEYRFKLLTQDATFDADHTVVVDLQAEDTNGLPIPACTVEGVILAEQFLQLYGDSSHVQDTLWTFVEEFGSRTTLSLSPPDSIWPAGKLKTALRVHFIGPSGESEHRSTTLTVNRPQWQPTIALKSHEVYVDIVGKRTQMVDTVGQLIIVSSHTLDTLTVLPGSTVKLNPYASQYIYQVDGKQTYLTPNKEQAGVHVNSSWVNDTLRLQWFNPHQLPTQWQLTTTGRVWNGGTFYGDTLLLLPFPQERRQVWLKHSYPWAGSIQVQQQDIKFLQKALTFEIAAPKRVYPGQEVTVEVQAYDIKGKPAPQVVLATGAYNGQFKQGTPVSTSDINFRGRKVPFIRQNYGLSKLYVKRDRNLNQAWYERLSLHQFPYYQLRYPNTGRWEQYTLAISKDSLVTKTAQVAPWLVSNGQVVPAHLIFVDNRLKYYQSAWQDTPYSLVIEPGTHRIAIRTYDQEIIVEDVELRAGHKLDFSIDLDHPPKGITITERPIRLTDRERSILEQNTMYWRINNRSQLSQYLYQNPRHIFVANNNILANQAWGLLQPNRNTMWLPKAANMDTLSFNFESGFSYIISKGRDRLYEYYPLRGKNNAGLSKWSPLPQLGQFAVFPADIPAYPNHIYYRFDKFNQEIDRNRARLQLLNVRSGIGFKYFLLVEKGKPKALLPPRTDMISLIAGHYQLIAIDHLDRAYNISLELAPNKLTAIHFQKEQFDTVALPLAWSEFIKERTMEKPFDEYYSSSYDFLDGDRKAANRSEENKDQRLISGYIKDETSQEPLIGASVLLVGTGKGTVTDFDGYYQLWVPYGPVELQISYTGFDTQQFTIDNRDIFNTNLGISSADLDEVVVVGYGLGERKKSNAVTLTSSILQSQVAGIRLGSEATMPLTNKQQFSLDNQALEIPLDSVRITFQDYAYWQPLLTTDQQGQATFTVTFPDDITSWRHFAVGMDKHQRVGLGGAVTSAYLPLQAQLYTPRFLIEGDIGSVTGVLTNRSGQQQQLEQYLRYPDGRRILQSLKLDDSKRENFALPPAPTDQDSIWLQFGLTADNNYRDGERRPIPIYRRGSYRTVGGFTVLRDDTLLQLNTQPEYGPIDLRIGGNALPNIHREISYVSEYPYHCNEQTASRLIALLAAQKLKGRSPSIELDERIRKALNRLGKNRQNNGSWGWWRSSEKPSLWITQHVLYAMQEAKQAGYSIPNTDAAERWVLQQLDQLPAGQQLDLLLFLAQRGQPLDYATYLAPYDTIIRNLDQDLAYQRIRQLQGWEVDLGRIRELSRHTMTGAQYWGFPTPYTYRPVRQAVQQSLLAYDLFRDAGRKEEVQAIQQFFLEDDPFVQRKHDYYRWGLNTYESSHLVQALLPDVLGDNNTLDQLTVGLQLGQLLVDTIQRFPFETKIAANTSAASLSKSGDGPAFIAYAQTYWENNPKEESNGFKISTGWEQEGRIDKPLQTATSATMAAKLVVDKDAQYVKIEIPVPGGCSYGQKIFREIPWETHREYRRDRVIIFCEFLPAGVHRFTVPMEPRFPGKYTINPATVEMMYIPSFRGSGKVREVDIVHSR